MRILFFGDGVWATNSLSRLAQEHIELAGLVTRTKPTDPALLDMAKKMGIPVLQPIRVNEPDFIDQVTDIKPDLNLSVSYDQILRREILTTAPLGFINFHAGRLPNYRGRNVINWAIINNEKEIGITGHYVDEGIDTGDIIAQHTIPIEWTDTYGTILEKVINAIPDLVMETVLLIIKGEVHPHSQEKSVGTYFARREEGDEWLDWSDSSLDLYNKIRAITIPGPGARTFIGDKVVTIWSAVYDPKWPKYIANNGQIVGKRPGEGVLIKTGDSTLLLKKIQVGDNEPEIPAWPIGTRLGKNLPSYLMGLQTKLNRLEKTVERLTLNGGTNDHSHHTQT
jgi:methionyl-tRNA formyltransferase